MYRLFKKLGKQPFRSVSEAVKQWVNICYILSEYNKVSENMQFRIFDQGLAQAAISLAANCDKPTSVVVLNELLKMVKVDPYFFYIQAKEDTVLIRLKHRKIGKTRVIQYTKDDQEKVMMLQKIKSRCEEIIKYSPSHIKGFSNDENTVLEEICQSIVYECLFLLEEKNVYKRTGINHYSNI